MTRANEFPLHEMFDHFAKFAKNQDFLRAAETLLGQPKQMVAAPFIRFDNQNQPFSLHDAAETALMLNVQLTHVFSNDPQLDRISFSASGDGRPHVRLQLGDAYNTGRDLVSAFANILPALENLQARVLTHTQKAQTTPALKLGIRRDLGAELRRAAQDDHVSDQAFENMVRGLNKDVINSTNLKGESALHFALRAGRYNNVGALLNTDLAVVDDKAIDLAQNARNMPQTLKDQLSHKYSMETPRSSMSFRW